MSAKSDLNFFSKIFTCKLVSPEGPIARLKLEDGHGNESHHESD